MAKAKIGKKKVVKNKFQKLVLLGKKEKVGLKTSKEKALLGKC